MIIDVNGKKRPEPSILLGRVRAWLDALNKARETRDPIDAARINTAQQELAVMLRAVQTGHVKVPDEQLPLLVALDVLFGMAGHLVAAVRYHRGVGRRLMALTRGVEEDVRALLATLSGEAVDPRSTANDANEDRHLEDVPVAPPAPKVIV